MEIYDDDTFSSIEFTTKFKVEKSELINERFHNIVEETYRKLSSHLEKKIREHIDSDYVLASASRLVIDTISNNMEFKEYIVATIIRRIESMDDKGFRDAMLFFLARG